MEANQADEWNGKASPGEAQIRQKGFMQRSKDRTFNVGWTERMKSLL